MTDLHALIEELEQAKEGSRELDAAITKYIFPKLKRQHASFYIDGIRIEIQPYTTSLDATLQLVPEGVGWDINVLVAIAHEPKLIIAHVDGRLSGGHTPALALVLATLKARAGEG